ncbi:hypothetical protein B7C42_08182 [Nocardia cerradoensis]|uniref:Uncharacterized protein n=1 Tax=Nocardia cerradoensis TaxID=85688 RepID=A0A231GSZ3_9NOCA|nr:hypothetical protein B7C42_08182 [Nocardia cerradoensis]
MLDGVTDDVLLDVPAGLRQWLCGADSRAEIDGHGVHITPTWWARNLVTYGFDNPVADSSVTRGSCSRWPMPRSRQPMGR